MDGIKAEFILDASEMLLDPLMITFNQALEHGVPAAWCVGVIHPIFKAGDRYDPGNYRGITVVVILPSYMPWCLKPGQQHGLSTGIAEPRARLVSGRIPHD